MLRSAGIAGLALLVTSGCDLSRITGSVESNVWTAGTAPHSLLVGDLVRTFHVHIPSKRLVRNGLPAGWPLVVVLHGSGADGTAIESASAMDSLADANLFVVAYPDASRGVVDIYPSDWNAGTCCGGAYRDGVDDVAFIRGMVAQVMAKVTIDVHRIYAAGFSAGGRMAYHVGCQLGTLFAAIAVASGSLVDDACAPTVGVPLIATHSTGDPEVDYNEPSPPLPRAAPVLATPLPPALQYWSAMSKCSGGTVTTPTEHVTRTTCTSCSGAEIQFYRIDGGGHGWPGGEEPPGSDPPMNELHFSAVAWQFFNRKTR